MSAQMIVDGTWEAILDASLYNADQSQVEAGLKTLGFFQNEVDAARAYDAAFRESKFVHGGYDPGGVIRFLNFPTVSATSLFSFLWRSPDSSLDVSELLHHVPVLGRRHREAPRPTFQRRRNRGVQRRIR